jgi:hypothetical protein
MDRLDQFAAAALTGLLATSTAVAVLEMSPRA